MTIPLRAFTYLFDPLCGWCYGAAPALHRLAAMPDVAIEMLPTGLFADTASRPMTDAFADYAWSNDKRIETLTGQPFTDAYRDTVLGDRTRRFDSGPATLALAAVASTEPRREMGALSTLQAARYVDGRDTTAPAVLAAILADHGFTAASALVAAPTDALKAFNADRIARARSLMQAVGAQGVPTLVRHTPEGPERLDSGLLFAGPERISAVLSAG